MRRALALLALVAAPVAAPAQDAATLADIRGQIAALAAEIGGLRGELTATGTLSQGVAGATPLDRLNAIEAELQRLTSLTEQLEFRISQVVSDGTNRLGDLEFRVCEIEEGCDVSQLGATPTLGGTEGTTVLTDPAPAGAAASPASPAAPAGPELAVSEQADFEAAESALAEGDFSGAADRFAAFVAAYPGSPLTARANLGRGSALDAVGGRDADAARAYLDSFSAAPDGPFAADALLGLGRNLGRLGQIPDACVTLSEIGARFPDSPLLAEANAERQTLACP